jgi:hypothetical protein
MGILVTSRHGVDSEGQRNQKNEKLSHQSRCSDSHFQHVPS